MNAPDPVPEPSSATNRPDAAPPRGADGRIASPCVNVCRMNAATGLCDGCLRTIDEIAAWSRLDDRARHAVWVALAARRPARRIP